ncbi:hypothetical protein ACWCPF_41695 [Streptomyces sp. NPDC001858]
MEVEDGADEHVPRAWQDHYEGPDPAPFAGARVVPLAKEGGADLVLLARLDVLAQDGDLRPCHFVGQHGVDQRRIAEIDT